MWRLGAACGSSFAAIAGCYAPSAPLGAPCAPPEQGERCPSGQRCVLSAGLEVCDVDDPDGDLDAGDAGFDDGDGLDRGEDNCPDVFNPDQADEDGDGLGDACDPCPPFADNTDTDGDGVGDRCDPNPAVAGDRIVAFEGFAGVLPASWSAEGLFGTHEGDAIASNGPNTSARLTFPAPATARVEIRAAMTLGSITASGLDLGAGGIVDQLAPGTDRGIVCQLSSLVDGGQQQLRIFDTSSSTLVNTAAHPFTIGQRTELQLRRDGTSYLCGATSPVLAIAGEASFAPASPRIGLRARSALILYHWVMIVSSP